MGGRPYHTPPKPSVTEALDQALLAAHAQNDHLALIALYEHAAEATSNEPARGFFLTQAYVFALDTGDARADRLKEALVALGRDIPTPNDP